MSKWRHVKWEPINDSGTQWLASYNAIRRGEVKRICGGYYVARISGRRTRKYGQTMNEVAKHLVAFVNNVAPSKLL